MYRVLVVDDEIYECEGIRRQLSWDSYGIGTVDTAENGLSALHKFEIAPYDIVISDVKMPVMDGLTMALRMREIMPTVKILFLSGYDDFIYVKQAIQLHAYDYLLKPVGNELEEKIKEMTDLLNQERMVQEREETMMAENSWQMMTLGTELLDYLINGRWNSMMRILKNLKYLEQPYLIVGYGFREQPVELRQNQLMQELRDCMSHMSESHLIGLCEREMLVLFPCVKAMAGHDRDAAARRLEKELLYKNAGAWTFYLMCFPVNDQLSDQIRSWKETELLPVLQNAGSVRQNPMILKKIVSIVQSRYMENLTIKKIADELLYSPNYLSMIFKRTTGQGFYEYLVSVRMEKAGKMLLEENAKVYMVANAVGYEDTVAFIKRFKKEFGCTPTQFRNQRQL